MSDNVKKSPEEEIEALREEIERLHEFYMDPSRSDPERRESLWIKALRAEVGRLNDEGANIWTDVNVKLCLGDARRLLWLLDLARKDGIPHRAVSEEAYLLATGAMEG
jgi:hypothetical protein